MSRTHHHGAYDKPWVKLPPGAYWARMTPGWWTKIWMNRPKRKSDRNLLRNVAAGKVDADDAAFGLGNHKPHIYYW